MSTFPLALDGRLLSLPTEQYFPEGVGKYRLRVTAAFSNTNPSSSSSEWVEIEIKPVPVTTRLDNAIASPEDNSNWQLVIDAPDSTEQQKAIAQDMIALNQEIALGVDFGVSIAEVLNDRSVYLSELQQGRTSLTFAKWLQQQRDVTSPIEQQEAKDFVAAAPTSSIDALLSYFNAIKHPYGSVIRLILGGIPGRTSGDWTFIRNNSQRYGGQVPDNVILNDYKRYQTAMQTASLVIPFEDWIHPV